MKQRRCDEVMKSICDLMAGHDGTCISDHETCGRCNAIIRRASYSNVIIGHTESDCIRVLARRIANLERR